MTRYLIGGVAVMVALTAIGWSINVPRFFGFSLYTEQFLAVILGLTMMLAFLATSARGNARQGNIPWYDILAGGLSLAACLHLAYDYEQMMFAVFDMSVTAVVLASLILLALLEAMRRVAGFFLMLLVGVFLLVGLFSHLIPGSLQGREVAWSEVFVYLVTDNNAILGTPLLVTSTIVVAFLLIGELLNRSGGASFFTDAAISAMGRFRGGPAKIAVLASGLFGSVSGSAVSNVASTGAITIPLMKRSGYAAKDAGAIEAVASTGGQLMPPIMGAVAFLMAEFLQVPYSQVVMAALIPALLYYISLFFLVDLYAAKHQIASLSDEEIPDKFKVLKRGVWFVLPFVLLILLLFVYAYSAVMSALLSAVSVILVGMAFGYQGERLKLSGIIQALASTGKAIAVVAIIAAGAGIVIGALNMSGVGFSLTDTLARIGDGNLLVLLLLVAALAILLGMGMPTVGVYILLATLLAPSLVEAGVTPMAAHLFILYFGMLSMITPPISLASFTAAALAGTRPMETAMQSVFFGWAAYVIPFMFVLSPSMILDSSVLEAVISLVVASFGMLCICCAMAGYFSGALSMTRRLIMASIGVALLIPHDVFMGGVIINMVGGVGLLIFSIITLLKKHMLKSEVC